MPRALASPHVAGKLDQFLEGPTRPRRPGSRRGMGRDEGTARFHWLLMIPVGGWPIAWPKQPAHDRTRFQKRIDHSAFWIGRPPGRMKRQENRGDPGTDRAIAQGFVRSTRTGLFLPDRLAGHHQHSGAEWFGIRARWCDVYGEDPGWDDVANRLSEFGLGQVLVALGGVSAVLNSYERLDGQQRIILALFRDPDKVGRAFQAYLDRVKREGEPEPVFFTEQQVVAITKIALLVCPHVTERSGGSFEPIGEALMMAADLIDREEGEELTSDVGPGGSRDAWLRFVVMNGLFNASDDFRNALARTYDLYLADGSGHDAVGGSVDLRRRFEEITGLDPDFAWGTGMALFANWRTVDPKSDRPPGPLSLEAYMSALNITAAEFTAIQRLFVVEAGEAREELRQRGCGPDSLRPYDIEPLDRSPLVSLERRLYCPSVQLLRWKLTTGLHHVFLRPSTQNNRARRDEYLKHAGLVFEEYVEALFRRVFPQTAHRFVDERALRLRIPSGMKACDGVVLYGDTVVLLEYKAALLRYDVRAKGDLSALRTKVADTFGRAAKQFDDTILAIEDGCLGEFVRPGMVTRYLPLVVTLETLPLNWFFYRVIEEAIAEGGGLGHSKARALQVVAVSELELLEEHMAAGGSLAGLLLERIESDTYRDSPLKNYLLERGAHGVLRPSSRLQRRFREISDRMTLMMRERAGGPW